MPPQPVIAVFAIAWAVFCVWGSFALARMLARSAWNAPLEPYPPIEPNPADGPADDRRFQSMRAGFVNLGWSVHVIADRRYLHLRTSRIGRLLALRDASVPWDELRFAGPTFLNVGPARSMKVGAISIAVPAWIAEHAERVAV
ncbi:MAG: hypothetical protein AAGK04_04910 [Planctomycetota bacterium]